MGIVYLVQPCELVGTDRYKIGMSNKNTLYRIKNGYKKGTEIIRVYNCDFPLAIEKYIKEEFNEKFKLIAGKEFFEGEKTEIKNVFDICFNLHKNKKEFVSKEAQKEEAARIAYMDSRTDRWIHDRLFHLGYHSA